MFSVIVPTCNRNNALSLCLNRLSPLAQHYRGNYEVIVTDDSKNDIAADLIKVQYPWATWIKGPGRGPAANRNNGARNATNKWLVFIDDDCLPGKNLLNEYSIAIKSNADMPAFEGAILPENSALLKKDLAECPVNTEGGCFWSANICMHETIFNEVSGFNETYLIAAQEDQQMKIDIESILKKKIMFLPNAKVIHPVRFLSIKEKLKKIPLVSKNYCLYAVKNRNILGYSSSFNFLKQQIVFHTRALLSSLKKAHFKNFVVEMAWLIWGVPLNAINFYKLKIKHNS